VSLNTAYNEAKAIQSNASSGTNPGGFANPAAKFSVTIDAIYLQGNGQDPIEPYFLQYLSNQISLQVPGVRLHGHHVSLYSDLHRQSELRIQPAGRNLCLGKQHGAAFDRV
jgi:hypothetical protein